MIERLKALEAAATPGPWIKPDGREYIEANGKSIIADYAFSDCMSEENAVLIAALRNLAPEMIALIEAVDGWIYGDTHKEGARLTEAMDALNAKTKEVLG